VRQCKLSFYTPDINCRPPSCNAVHEVTEALCVLLHANNRSRESPLPMEELIQEVGNMLRTTSGLDISDKTASLIVDFIKSPGRQTGDLKAPHASLAPTVVDDSLSTEKSHGQYCHENRGDESPGRIETQVASQLPKRPSHELERFPEVRVSIIMSKNMDEAQPNDKVVVNPATQEDNGEEAEIQGSTICAGAPKSAEEACIVETQDSTGSPGSSDAEFGLKYLSFKLTPAGVHSTGDDPRLKPSQPDEIELNPGEQEELEEPATKKKRTKAPKKKKARPTETSREECQPSQGSSVYDVFHSDSNVDSSTKDSFQATVIENMMFIASYFETGAKTFFPDCSLSENAVVESNAGTLALIYYESWRLLSDGILNVVKWKIRMVQFAVVFNNIVQ